MKIKDKKYLLSIFVYIAMSLPSCLLANYYNVPIGLILIAFCLVTIIFIISLIKINSSTIEKYYLSERDMLYNILEDVNAMIIVWSDNLKVNNVNDCFFRMTGYNESNCNDKELLKQIFDIDSKDINEDNICNDRESKIICTNGEKLTTFWKTTIINSVNNCNTYMSIGIDTTEITNIQNELSASENRFEMSMELSEVGLLYRRLGSDKYLMSKNLQKLIGFSNQKVLASDFVKKIYPNDVTLFESYYTNCIERANEEIHKVTSIELRIACADGGFHWFNYRFKLSKCGEDGSISIGGSLIDISKDKEKDTLIEKMAYIDEITQIYNRNRFMMMGQETYKCSRELDLSYWLIIFDIDNFHIINDTCGYQNGNKLLKYIAITILKNLSDGGFCARIGGNNFAILLKDSGDDESPIQMIQKIQAGLYDLSTGVYANQTITASAGYCKLPIDGADFSEILEHAEFALRLGENPRSNIVRYDNTVHDKIIAKTAIEKELQKAIDKNELKLFYQPKINLSDNKIMGAEALIRWVKPDGTIIPPSSFIPIAESSNLITKISKFVVNEACKQNKKWQDMGLPNINISVNLSSVDFYQTDVCDTINTAITDSGLDPEWLEVELTESLALKDVEQAIRQMNELKELGVKISMDDFGTGYSSLSYIQVLPITMLKLDRSFIMYLEDDNISREIVTSVINICKSKQIKIIAEGIETLGQAEILKNAGCDLAQGFYFGKPMPSDTFEQFVKQAI